MNHTQMKETERFSIDQMAMSISDRQALEDACRNEYQALFAGFQIWVKDFTLETHPDYLMDRAKELVALHQTLKNTYDIPTTNDDFKLLTTNP